MVMVEQNARLALTMVDHGYDNDSLNRIGAPATEGSFSPHLLARVGLSVSDFAPIQEAMAAGAPDRACDQVMPAMLSLGVAGGAEEVTERCRGLVAAGAHHLSFEPHLGLDPAEAIRMTAGEILPPVRAMAVAG